MANDNPEAARQAAMSAQTRSPNVPPDDSAGYNSGQTWGPIPRLTAELNFREIGQSGLRQFSGWVREEFLPTLIGRQGAQKFREMRDNSPVIGGMLFAIESMMRKVEWRIQTPDDGPGSKESGDFVESMMDDMSHTWEDHVGEVLSMLPFGFAFHEIVYKKRLGRDPGIDPKTGKDLAGSLYDDGKISWRRIPLRSQDTTLKWFFDQNGQAVGMTQQPWIGPLVDIPIEKAMLFRAKPFKNNPEGISILRSCYLPYYYVKRIQEQEAILCERLGGVPVIQLPAGLLDASKTDANAASVVAAYQKIVQNLRIDEQMGVILPSDPWMGPNGPSSAPQYKFELVTPQNRTNSIDFDKIVARYNIQMMTSVLADFLTLGHEARGTQSLAVTKVDMFFQAIEGFLNSMAAVYNRYGLPRLWKLNGDDFDTMPTIVPDLAQRTDLDVLSNFVLRLSQAGMPMFPNEDLQTFLLDAGGLPDIQDDRALQAAGLTDEQLDVQDQKDQAALDRMQAPPQPVAPPGTPMKPGDTPNDTNLKKMIAASIARRLIRNAGPRHGVHTTKRHVRTTRRVHSVR